VEEEVDLNLGCGNYYVDDWVNVDLADNGVRVDVAHDIRLPLPFDRNAADRVYMGHVLEHVPFDALVPVLAEVRRVLVSGGLACIVGPDVGLTLRDPRWSHIMDPVLYGARRWNGDTHEWTSTGEAHVLAARLAGFDPKLIDVAAVPLDWPVVSREGWQFAVMCS
jgi:SAM-dependent methyltransferase